MELVSGLTRDRDDQRVCAPPEPPPEIKAETAIRDDLAGRKARAYKKASSPRQKFVHFGPVTEIDQRRWQRLSIGKPGPREQAEVTGHDSRMQTCSGSPGSAAASSLKEEQVLNARSDGRYFAPSLCQDIAWESLLLLKPLPKLINSPLEMTGL